MHYNEQHQVQNNRQSIMQVINHSDLRSRFKEVMDLSWGNSDPVLITRSNGHHMVMLPFPEYEALTETQYLLQNEANALHLKKSLNSAAQGKLVDWSLPDEN